jgi:hypothetical protein
MLTRFGSIDAINRKHSKREIVIATQVPLLDRLRYPHRYHAGQCENCGKGMGEQVDGLSIVKCFEDLCARRRNMKHDVVIADGQRELEFDALMASEPPGVEATLSPEKGHSGSAVIVIMANTRTSGVVPSLQLTESSMKFSYSMFWLRMRWSESKSTSRGLLPPFTTRSRRIATHLILVVSVWARALTTNSRCLRRSPILSTRRRWIAVTIDQIGSK